MRRLCLAVPALMCAASLEAGELKKMRDRIPGQYIVVLQAAAFEAQGVAAESAGEVHAASYGVKTKHVYRHALRGYAAALTPAQVEELLADPRVAYVEEDSIVRAVATQTGATWGLDRIDQRDRPLSTTYTYNFDGSGVHAYIVDTGVRGAHVEFTGRMGNGFTSISDGNGTTDCNGHGTHVAGTVGGTTWGVAKRVTLHAVRVLDCGGSGSNAGVIAGVDWVRLNHVKPAVANMSLGGGASSALDTAVANAVAAGVTFAVAAGNENADACTRSPARTASAITVGSSTSGDVRSSFSNWGTCVDIFAPGSGITSAWSTSNTATNTISGTSMATPHVAGVVALYLQQHGHTAPATVASALNSNASLSKLTSIGTGSPNRLLYSLFGGGTPPPTPTPRPTVHPTITPTPTPSDGYYNITPPASLVTASANDGNLPANTVDGSLATRWSASGDGQWLQLDLGAPKLVGYVKIAFYNGNLRRTTFDLQCGNDGVWSNLRTGVMSSGTTTALETFDLPDTSCRLVRYLGHGNTVNSWNSLTEVEIWQGFGVTPPPPTPTPTAIVTPTPTAQPTYVEVTPAGSAVTASMNDGNLPANAVDNSLASRWSANGDGHWLQLDLGAARTVGYVTVAAYNGNMRRNRFDLQVSSDGVTWTTVLPGALTGGATTAEETFDFTDVTARLVRYVGHGNTDPTKETWNSVTEVSVFAVP